MHAISKLKAEPGLWATEVDKPTCGPNDLLVKIKKTGICGTDLHIANWDAWSQKTVKTPMVIGHEFMGEVAEVGSAVFGFSMGDRVSGEGHLTCATCRNCRGGRRHLCRNALGIGVHIPGAFAEYLALPARNAFLLPPEIDDDVAAIFDPLGNAVHTALSFDLVGKDVLITGSGPIGVMSVAVACHAGARHIVITDVNDHRLKMAEKMGATKTVNVQKSSIAEAMDALNMQEGFDVGFEMSGNEQALRDIIHAMNHGGKLALLGLPSDAVAIDWSDVIFKGLILKGIYGRKIFGTWYKMTSMLQSGLNIAPVITHHFPWQEFEKGLDVMRSGEAGKVVLHW